MLFYVAYDENYLIFGKQITNALQKRDKENSYVCGNLVFEGIENNDEQCLDLLSVCDKLIVASNITKTVDRDINFANLVGMEVEYLSDA